MALGSGIAFAQNFPNLPAGFVSVPIDLTNTTSVVPGINWWSDNAGGNLWEYGQLAMADANVFSDFYSEGGSPELQTTLTLDSGGQL